MRLLYAGALGLVFGGGLSIAETPQLAIALGLLIMLVIAFSVAATAPRRPHSPARRIDTWE